MAAPVQQLIGGNDSAGGGILDGQNTAVDFSGFYRFAYIREGGIELRLRLRKQHPQGGLRVGAPGALAPCTDTGQGLHLPEGGHPGCIRQNLLLVAFADVHNGGKECCGTLGHIRRRHIPDSPDYLVLPVLLKDRKLMLLFIDAYLTAQGHTLCKGVENGFVQLIDL